MTLIIFIRLTGLGSFYQALVRSASISYIETLHEDIIPVVSHTRQQMKGLFDVLHQEEN